MRAEDSAPWDVSERKLLSGILRDPTLLDCVVLEPWHLSTQTRRMVWEAAAKMHKDGVVVTPNSVLNTITNTAGQDTPDLLRSIALALPKLGADADECTVEVAQYYTQQITQYATLREMARNLPALQALAEANDLRALEEAPKLAALVGSLRKQDPLRPWGAVVDDMLHDVDMQREGTMPPPVPTGLALLDAAQSLMPGELTILGARPSVGKSVMALTIARAAARAEHSVMFVSLEMRDRKLARRVMSLDAGVRFGQLKSGILSDEEWDRVTASHSRQHDWPIFTMDRGRMDLPAITAAARRLHATRGGLSLLIIDYIQKMPLNIGRNGSRREGVAELSGAMKTLANDLECAVLCLAQLNRQASSGDDKRPTLENLREAGDLEQDADTVLLMSPALAEGTSVSDWKKKVERPVLLDVAKSRDGETMDIPLYFNGDMMRFGQADTQYSQWP